MRAPGSKQPATWLCAERPPSGGASGASSSLMRHPHQMGRCESPTVASARLWSARISAVVGTVTCRGHVCGGVKTTCINVLCACVCVCVCVGGGTALFLTGSLAPAASALLSFKPPPLILPSAHA